MPFLQALATQAGARTYEQLTQWGLRFKTRATGPVQYTIDIRDEGTGTVFQLPPNLPDQALEALVRADLELLAAPGNKMPAVIYWDGNQWMREGKPVPLVAPATRTGTQRNTNHPLREQ
ncbi:hypothetical protein [Streptomyces cellostaticus]|uniref:hypothetical protein n=1 Tax=Streptomyces cellostaticus TaxID=67285 RepID=UPI002026C921|nr:hypothetical protein [Streptomyces cellostaticus]